MRKPDPACRYCAGRGTYIGGDEIRLCWCVEERRTLIRRRADAHRADVLRGERTTFEGEVVKS